MRGVVARRLAIGLALGCAALGTVADAKDAKRKSKREERFVPAAHLRGSGVVVVQANRPFVLWSGDERLGECAAKATIRLVVKPGLLLLSAVGPDDERKTADVTVEANRVHPVGFYFGANAVNPAVPGAPSTVTPPKLVMRVNPDYPSSARRNGVEGQVVVECLITDEGNVVITRILKSIPELDESAITAVREWKYEPAQFEGHAQVAFLTVRLNYTASR